MDPSNYIEVNSAHKSNFYYKLTPKSVYTDITSLALNNNTPGILSGEVDFRTKTIKPIKITYKNTAYGFSGTLTAYLSSPVCVRVSIPDTTNLVGSEPSAQLSTNFKIETISYPPNGSIKYVECEKKSDKTIDVSKYGDLSVKITNPLFIDGLDVTSQNLLLKKDAKYVSFNSNDITAFNKSIEWDKTATTISTNLFISELCCKIDDFSSPISGDYANTAFAQLTVMSNAKTLAQKTTNTLNISSIPNVKTCTDLYPMWVIGGTRAITHATQVSTYQGTKINQCQKGLYGDGYYHWQWTTPVTANVDISVMQVQFKKCELLDNLSVHSITLSANFMATKTKPSMTKLTLYSISDRTNENVISCQKS